MAKHIFVTGGVISSLGKGITSASIGLILRKQGLRVAMQKLDPYINVDPGTMNPYEHGEVYVTEDGAETDLDLGHYERFTGVFVSRDSNYTTGQIYSSIIQKERDGKFLGKTVQVIPHVTDEIKSVIRKLATPDVDVVITEIGGTVGDIEGLPFLEAIRQLRYDVGSQNCIFIHLTLVPYIRAAGEIKTKPTQQSVGELRRIGIQPDILIIRSSRNLTEEARRKIALYCNVDAECVIEEVDVEHSIYEVPLNLIEQKLDVIIAEKLRALMPRPDMTEWEQVVKRVKNLKRNVDIAVVGKYIEHQDAYKSIYESLAHAGISHEARVNVRRVEAEDLERDGAEKWLAGVDGILVPGGFGIRGTEGKIQAVQYARKNDIPYFGICLGMQCAVIEFARNACGLADAHSFEFDTNTKHPVIALMDEQREITQMGGTMRLGAYPCRLKDKTLARKIYGEPDISERHRHRYEFNNTYRDQFEENGMTFSGLSPDGKLVEIVELSGHPFFVGVQFHPEFKSTPVKPQPIFRDFIAAAIQRRALK